MFDHLRGSLGRGWQALNTGVMDYSSRMLSISALYYRLLLNTFTVFTGWRPILRELLKQIYFTALQGAHILIFSSLLLGLAVIIHATTQLMKVQGEEYVGWLLVTIVVREIGPVWTAFFVLLHSGSAIIVELGNMSISGEVDSLEMLGVDPYRYLGVPRFWGITFSLVILYVLANIAAVLGGFLFAQLFGEIFWENFWDSFLHNLTWLDVAMGFSKTTSFGTVMATVCIYFGLQARRDLGQVAYFTSKGSLVGLVLIGSIDIILTTAYYL
jgi:phospholipid/cholesterol/gamma-HCH transport system permease protein